MANPLITPLQDFNTVDPMTQIYRQIRAILIADTVIGPKLGKANFPDLTDTSFFQLINKPGILTSDTPAVYLVQGKWVFVPVGPNSKSGTFVLSLPLIIVQDNQQLIPVNQFKWRLWVQLGINAPNLGLSPLVEKAWLDDAQDDLFGNTEFKQFQERWMTVATIKVSGFIDRNCYAAA